MKLILLTLIDVNLFIAQKIHAGNIVTQQD